MARKPHWSYSIGLGSGSNQVIYDVMMQYSYTEDFFLQGVRYYSISSYGLWAGSYYTRL
jgi:hypothetical protein